MKLSGITDTHLLKDRGWMQQKDSLSIVTSAVTNNSLDPTRVMYCDKIYRTTEYHLHTKHIEEVTCQGCKDAYAMEKLGEVP